MKKVIILFLLTVFFLSLNASDENILAGMYYQGEQEVETQQVQIPADFNYETANQELLKAREEGNIEQVNLISLQINAYWLENRVESFDPTTQGTGSSNGSIMYRNNEENLTNSPSIPYWFDDVRIDPRNGIRETSLASLSNGDIYCISRYFDGNWNILIRRSVNGGVTWTTFWDINFGTNTVYEPRIVECHDSLIISYIVRNGTDHWIWTILSAPGNVINYVCQGSPTGIIDGKISDFRICTESSNYVFIYATWTERYGTVDSTRVMFARSHNTDISTWEFGPNILGWTLGSSAYYIGTRIANGQGAKLWIVAHCHRDNPAWDDNIMGWYSSDFGSSWNVDNITSPNNGIDEYQPSIAGSHTNNNWVLLTTVSDPGYTYKRIRNYYSTNNGTTWTDAGWMYQGVNYRPDVWVDDNSTAFFGASRRDITADEEIIYKRGNISNPFSWSSSIVINDDISNLSNSYGPSVAYNYASGDAIIAWTNFNSSNYSIWFDDESWSTGVEETPVEVSGGMIVLSPNPSKDFATLSYSVINEGPVNISIYDASGRMVENLVNAVKQTGQHSLTIDNENLTSGFYIIRILTPEGVNTENMRVIK